MGHKGPFILLDEMEKWQDLNWSAQSSAGNLLGGLIWAATAPTGSRACRNNAEEEHGSKWMGKFFRCDHDARLMHSGRCGGYPFTTNGLCHLGVAIAVTPRGADGPERAWNRYGELGIVDLPTFDSACFRTYFAKIAPIFKQAHGLEGDIPFDVIEKASAYWRETDDRGSRSANTAILRALDNWQNNGWTHPRN